MLKKSNEKSKLLDAKEYLVTLPNDDELKRLVKYYPKYELEHRTLLLKGYFEGKSLKELVDDKLKAKKIDKEECSRQSLGGHARWVKFKVKRTIIRILYVQYRVDEDMTQRKAHQLLLKVFSSNAKDVGQSAIRKATYSKILDK